MFDSRGQHPPLPTWLPVLGAFVILCAPNLLALILQHEIPMKIRMLGFGFSLAILALPWILTPGRMLLWGSLPLAVMAPFEAFHIAMMGVPSTEGMIGSLLDTTPREALELGWKVHVMIASALTIPAIQAWLLWMTRGSTLSMSRRSRLAALVLVAMVFALEGIHVARLPVSTRWKIVTAVDQFERTFPLGLLQKAASVAGQKAKLATRSYRIRDYQWLPVRATPDSVDETYVIIVGEASRAGNWSIYGYDRPTSPLTQRDTTLLVFENVTSGANLTYEAVAQILTLATPQNPERFETSSSIISAFRQAGFATSWLSLQSRFGLSDGKPAMIGLEAEEARFLTTDFSDNGSSHLDSALLPYLDSSLNSGAKKKLIVLHTLGSHYRYDRRYPPAFELFRDSSMEAPTERDQYDNSIAYSDWLVMQVKNRLQKQRGLKAMAFVSDHGEALGELGLSKHGNREPSRAEFEVPMVLWLSPELELCRPEVVGALRAHLDARANTSDFTATWLEVAGIRTPRADSTRNLARHTYQVRQRWAMGSTGTLLDVDRRRVSGKMSPVDSRVGNGFVEG